MKPEVDVEDHPNYSFARGGVCNKKALKGVARDKIDLMERRRWDK